MSFGFELLVILVMIFLNAIFAGYEMALASISRARLSALVSQKKKGAEAAAYMKDRMEASLAVIQLGITFVGAIAAATGGVGIEEALSPFLSNLGLSETWSEIISLICLIIPLSLLTIVFAELIPKIFSLRNKELVCLALSPAMKFLAMITYPIVAMFEKIVKKVIGFGFYASEAEESKQQSFYELRAAASLARNSKLIGAQEEKIVISAAQLSVLPIDSIMIPAPDILMIYAQSSLEEALIKAHMDMHTRFPVCEKENDPQTIVGYVNFKDIVLALKVSPSNPTVRGIMRPIKGFERKTVLSNAMEQMIREKIHIALVLSQQNAIEGMITLEDIFEELVGKIEDEFDRMPTHIHPYGPAWIFGGGVPLRTVNTKLGGDFFSAEDKVVTLNDWCHQKLGRAPKGGDVITEENIRLMVRKTRRKKAAEIILNVVSP